MRKLSLSFILLCCTIVSCAIGENNEVFQPYLQIRPESITFDAKGGVENVQVLANFDYEIVPNVDWLSAEKDNSRDFWIKVTATASKVTEVRSGEISIVSKVDNTSKSIKVSQSAYVKPINTDGWAEMPAKVEDANWEYGYHDKLPSNNKLRNYSFCFDKSKHCALWVAYPLHKCYIEGNGHRTEDWGYDPCCIDDTYEPNLRNSYYSQGGGTNTHSRGHQLPSADRLASDEDNATTFYYTNMTPQLQSLNGGTWQSLEENITKKWICSDTLYVVTGAHFAAGYGYAYDNKGNGKACAVPTHYYKVLLRTKSGNSGKWVGNCSASELKCVGFWFEHAAKAPRQTMSVAEIERKTGHTFFPNVKNAPKSTYNASEW